MVDIVFVLDQSGSITTTDPLNWDRMKQFLIDIVNGFTVRQDLARVGVVKFNNNAELIFYLNRYGFNQDVENVSTISRC